MRMEHARLPNLTRCQILESCDPISLPSRSKYHFSREYLFLTTCSNGINGRIFRKSLIIVYSLFFSLFLIRGCFPKSFLWSPFFAAWSKYHFFREYLFCVIYSRRINRWIFPKRGIIIMIKVYKFLKWPVFQIRFYDRLAIEISFFKRIFISCDLFELIDEYFPKVFSHRFTTF